MKTEPNLQEDIFAEDVMFSFSKEMHEALAPCIKQFLIDYFGEQFYSLESETYRDIVHIIREKIEQHADSIPDLIYRNRTITDSDLWNEALDKFDGNNTPVKWPENPHWYDKTFSLDDDDDFLEDIPESELTEEQKKALQIVDDVDNLLNFHNSFADFMKQGCEVLVPAMQSYIEEIGSFDLSILSPEGYESLQSRLELIADFVFDNLYGLLWNKV